MLRSYRLKGFTLIECLIALLILTGSIHLYQVLTTVTVGHVHHLNHRQDGDWLLFCQQLRSELDGSKFTKVTDNRLYVLKDGKHLAFGKSRADDFRKTNADGRGYQPMLYGIEKVTFQQVDHIVMANLIFKDGRVREFHYAFDKKS